MNISRRSLLQAGSSGTVVCVAGCLGGSQDTLPSTIQGWEYEKSPAVSTVTQYHDPSCSCCEDYVTYLEHHAIDVDVNELEGDEFYERKTELGIPPGVRSCHTVTANDYIIEGHVPLVAIDTLLNEQPSVRGISIPGMPQYAPGMGPPNDEPLIVEWFTRNGERGTFMEI